MRDKIEQLAKYLGVVNGDELRVLLGLPTSLDTVTTFDEAESFYHRTMIHDGGELRKAALAKMLELAATFDEFRTIHYASTHGEVGEAALEKMLELATTFDEAESVYYSSRHGSETHKSALAKMLKLVTTFNKAKWVYSLTLSNSGFSELEKAALATLTMLGNQALAEANTLDKAGWVYCVAPDYSELKKTALVKMLELTTTFDKVKSVCKREAGINELGEAALAKLTMLGNQALAGADTLVETKAVYYAAPDDSELKKAALAKMLESVTAFDEARSVYDSASDDGKIEEAALVKMLELTNILDEAKLVYNAANSSELKGMAVNKMLTLI